MLLDLRSHEAVVEHSGGGVERAALAPDRAVGTVTGEVLAAVRRLGGPVEIDPTPQEVPWSVPLDQDRDHTRYDAGQVADYFAAATQAALVLAEFRAPYRGRSTPVNAWWGSFDLAVNLFSGLPADPPSNDFIMRNAMDAQEVAVGWWPGDPRYGKAAFYAYAHPAPEGFAGASLSVPGARWDTSLGEYVLDWDDVRRSADPHAMALEFARRRLPLRLLGVRLGSGVGGQRRRNTPSGRLTHALDCRGRGRPELQTLGSQRKRRVQDQPPQPQTATTRTSVQLKAVPRKPACMPAAKWRTGKIRATQTIQAERSPSGMKIPDRKSSGRIVAFTTAGAASAFGMRSRRKAERAEAGRADDEHDEEAQEGGAVGMSAS